MRSRVGDPWRPAPAREPAHSRLLLLGFGIPALFWVGHLVYQVICTYFATARAAVALAGGGS
jgi:hypothetical protein